MVASNTLRLLESMAVVERRSEMSHLAETGAAAAALTVLPETTRTGSTRVFSGGAGAGLIDAVEPVRTDPASL